jgi:hypothetical protein
MGEHYDRWEMEMRVRHQRRRWVEYLLAGLAIVVAAGLGLFVMDGLYELCCG